MRTFNSGAHLCPGANPGVTQRGEPPPPRLGLGRNFVFLPHFTPGFFFNLNIKLPKLGNGAPGRFDPCEGDLRQKFIFYAFCSKSWAASKFSMTPNVMQVACHRLSLVSQLLTQKICGRINDFCRKKGFSHWVTRGRFLDQRQKIPPLGSRLNF